MTRTAGRLGTLKRIEGEARVGEAGAVVISDAPGFTGFDVSIQGTNETVPGGGALRSRDTGHKTGTCSYGVYHDGAAKALWDKHAHHATYLFQEDGSAAVERYFGFDSITCTFNEGGSIAYSVEVTLYEDVT